MRLHAWVVTGALFALLALLAILYFLPGSQGPRQPIPFYHRVHAGDRHIACQFCHRTVKEASFAGIPSTELCMRCHRVVIPQFPPIRELHGYWERRQPIPWVRVYALPGYVFYDHHAHTVTAGLDCDDCHGDVAAMDRVRQVAPLTMGWCLGCHQKRGAPENCWTCHR